MRHVFFLAGVGFWLATLSGCGGGDSSSDPAVAGNTSSAPAPVSTPAPVPAAAPAGSGSSEPGMQGSGATANPGSPGTSPGPQGSGNTTSEVMPPGSSSSGPAVVPAADQPQMVNTAPGNQPPGSSPYGSDSSAAAPGSAPSGTTPGPSYTPPGYQPAGSPPGGSSTSPASYPNGTTPSAYSPPGTSTESPAATPNGMESQPGSDAGYPGAGNAPGQPAEKPVTLLDIADLSFRNGRDQDAVNCLYGHALISDTEAAKEVLDKMGWIAPLKRPALAVRWGIAVEYVAPRNYNGNIFPVGTAQNVPVKGAAGGQAPGGQPPGGMADSGMGQGGMGAGPTNPLLQQLTGELGQKVVAQLQERMGRGDFGQVMASQDKPAATGAGGGMSGYMPSGGGSEMSGGMASAPGAGGYGASGQPQGVRPTAAVSLAPGIVMLGVVSAKDLREKGQKAGVDAVCVFDVVVTVNPRAQLIKNETTIHIHDLAQAKELYESKTLNNIQIQIERADPKGDEDPVDKELESLFKFVDANWRLSPLPAGLQAEHVLNRLKILLAESHENPLPVLAEARMYQTRGLLQDSHYLIACQKLLGDAEGTKLATGSKEERLTTVGKWLPQPPQR